jgi:hypothetical protein
VTDDSARSLAVRLRPILEDAAHRGITLTYLDLASAAGLGPPGAIHRVTEALEAMMREDHAAGRPLLAAVVVSARRGGLPAPGFFHLATGLGRYFGPERGGQAALFHAMELERVHAAFAAADPKHD